MKSTENVIHLVVLLLKPSGAQFETWVRYGEVAGFLRRDGSDHDQDLRGLDQAPGPPRSLSTPCFEDLDHVDCVVAIGHRD